MQQVVTHTALSNTTQHSIRTTPKNMDATAATAARHGRNLIRSATAIPASSAARPEVVTVRDVAVVCVGDSGVLTTVRADARVNDGDNGQWTHTGSTRHSIAGIMCRLLRVGSSVLRISDAMGRCNVRSKLSTR